MQNVGYRQNIIPEVPSQQHPLVPGVKVPLFRRHPAGTARQHLAFSGRGFIPDFMSEFGSFKQFPEASRTTLEYGFVNGSEGMMPPSGGYLNAQPGQGTDQGPGGAGSFA